jgi:hypothetical protein
MSAIQQRFDALLQWIRNVFKLHFPIARRFNLGQVALDPAQQLFRR